jgi:hypothetical protein
MIEMEAEFGNAGDSVRVNCKSALNEVDESE